MVQAPTTVLWPRMLWVQPDIEVVKDKAINIFSQLGSDSRDGFIVNIRDVRCFAAGNFKYSWKGEIERLGHSKKYEISLVLMRMLLIRVTLDVNVVIPFQLPPQPCHFSLFSSRQATKYTRD